MIKRQSCRLGIPCLNSEGDATIVVEPHLPSPPSSPVGPTFSALMGVKLNCHTREVSGRRAPSVVNPRSTKPCEPGSSVGTTRS